MSADIWMRESHVQIVEENGDEYHYNTGDTGWYETWYTTDDKPGKIFRHLQKQHGRCISKMYRETSMGDLHVGWVFQKRREYSDSFDTYLHETWVEIAPRYLPDEDED